MRGEALAGRCGCLGTSTFPTQAERGSARQTQAMARKYHKSRDSKQTRSHSSMHSRMDQISIHCARDASWYHALPKPSAPRSKRCCMPDAAIKKTFPICTAAAARHTHRCSPHNGSRWHPNSPRPPQFLRGVSCMETDSAGPDVLGRSALTWRGICGDQRWMHVCEVLVMHSRLRSVPQPRPRVTVSRGLSNPPTQTW